MRKHINSETTNYQDELTEVLVLDDKPVVNSFNGITSDAVARAVAGASGEVPQVTESDNGKVLKAVYDEGGPAVEWGDAAPAVTVDQTYNASSTNAQSGTAVAGAIAGVKQVPASTSADADKVLTVSSEGVPGWAPAQGGGGGSSVEAGAGLVKSGDTLSVDTGNGLRIGSTLLGTGYLPIGIDGSKLSYAKFLRMSSTPSRYVGSGEDTPTAYLYLVNSPSQGSETARGRYNKVSFSTVKNGDYLKIVGFPGDLDINLAPISIDMQLGVYNDLIYSGGYITTYIKFGYEDGQGNVTYFNEGGNGSVYTDSKLAAAVPFTNGSSQVGFVPVVDSNGSPAWSKSVFQAAYSLGGTKPTYTVDGNKIIIAASGNAPLTDSLKGIAPDGNYMKKLAILSMRVGLTYDYSLFNTGVNAKITLAFKRGSYNPWKWTFTGFRNLRFSYAVDLMCELPLYFSVYDSDHGGVMDLDSITIELTDDEGQAVTLSSSGQLADFGLVTHKLP